MKIFIVLVAVQHIINFHDAQQKEAMRERQRVEQAKRLSDDKMLEQLQWYRPRALDVNELMERGKESQEKSSQVFLLFTYFYLLFFKNFIFVIVFITSKHIYKNFVSLPL